MHKIKNIGIFAHVDAGKTTLTEHMLCACGVIRHAGSVDNGTAQTDTLDVERRRGISVRAASTSLIRGDTEINIIDTPGHIDFAGEAERALSAIDGAVLVVSAVEGVQSHTEALWRAMSRVWLPRIIFINKIDRAGSSTDKIIEDLRQYLGGIFVKMSYVCEEGSRACTVLSDFNSEHITELLADIDDEAAEAFIEGRKLTDEIILKKLSCAVADCKITPVFCGSAANGIGITDVLDGIVRYLPSSEMRSSDNLAGIVFKIDHDADMGKLAHIRMFGGELKNRDTVDSSILSRGGKSVELSEKITQIRKFNGAKYIDAGHIGTGDIAAVCGISNIRVGDILGEVSGIRGINSDGYKLANPFLTVRVSPKTQEQLMPLITALRELTEEEPLLGYRWEKTEREVNINLTGKIQLEIVDALLRDRYGLEASFSPPSVIYKETPSSVGYGFEAYTMPKPCWAVVKFKFEPLPRGKGVIYDGGKVPHNRLFYKYQTHIETCFKSSIEQGLYGWEITDFKCTLEDGEHHTIHTHPLDFFVATPMAIMNAMQNCGSTMLEPLIKVRISAPDDALGRVISDITMMRGEFDTPVIIGNSFTVEAILPVSASLDYPIKLASFTSGKAVFFSSFAGYREIPSELGVSAPRRGINPLDRSKWILYVRGAIRTENGESF